MTVIRAFFISLAVITLMTTTSASQIPRLQTGGTGDQVVAADGLSATLFAQRAGQIADMVRGDDGTLYLADRSGGRILRVIDRDMNGRADLMQPLPHRFDGPGGLAIIDETLFVSDRGGVWRIDPDGGTPVLLAPFANADISEDPVPLVALTSGMIRMGLNRRDGTASLIDVDALTGRADAVESAPGRILSFSRQAHPSDEAEGDALGHDRLSWVILQRDGRTFAGSRLRSATPVASSATHLWLDPATGQALMGLTDRVSEARASFEGLSEPGRDILSGLNGGVGTMVTDVRGLFIAEPRRGRVWRVEAAKPETIKSEILKPESETDEVQGADGLPPPGAEKAGPESSQPALLRGSGIGQASQMGSASTMGPASKLPPAAPPSQTPTQIPTQQSEDDPD